MSGPPAYVVLWRINTPCQDQILSKLSHRRTADSLMLCCRHSNILYQRSLQFLKHFFFIYASQTSVFIHNGHKVDRRDLTRLKIFLFFFLFLLARLRRRRRRSSHRVTDSQPSLTPPHTRSSVCVCVCVSRR